MSNGVTAAPAKAVKAPPEGVERTLQATLRYAVGMPALAANPEKTECVEKFLSNPLAGGHEGFTELPPSNAGIYVSTGHQVAAMCLMTKKKKPIGVAMSSTGQPCILLRGDRTKQVADKYFEVDKETAGYLAASLYTVQPNEPCNFHPWFSSVVWAYSMCHSKTIRTVTRDDADVIATGINTGRVLVAVCMPSPASLESMLHKLAIDKPMSLQTSAEVAEHHAQWKRTVEANKYDASSLFQTLNDVCAGIQKFASLWKPAALAASAAPKPSAVGAKPVSIPISDKKAGKQPVVDVEEDELEAAPKRLSQPKTDATKQDGDFIQRGGEGRDRYERSGQSKFIADSIEAGAREDEIEKSKQRKFKRKLRRIMGSDSDDSDNDDGSQSDPESSPAQKKSKHDSDDESASGSNSASRLGSKKKKKKHCDSDDDEDELSDSDDDDSEEESEEDSNDDSDEDLSSSEEEASATSSDDDDDAKRAKKRKLVKTSAAETRERKMVQPTLQQLSSAEFSSKQVSEQPKRKQAVRQPPAKASRAQVADKCNLWLDKVEKSTGIPMSMVEETNNLVAHVRERFEEYKSDKFPIKNSYELHDAKIDLGMLLTRVINAGLSDEQKNSDATATRRLAVSTMSALVKLVPCIEKAASQVKESSEAINALLKATAEIADDFKASAALIEEE